MTGKRTVDTTACFVADLLVRWICAMNSSRISGMVCAAESGYTRTISSTFLLYMSAHHHLAQVSHKSHTHTHIYKADAYTYHHSPPSPKTQSRSPRIRFTAHRTPSSSYCVSPSTRRSCLRISWPFGLILGVCVLKGWRGGLFWWVCWQI